MSETVIRVLKKYIIRLCVWPSVIVLGYYALKYGITNNYNLDYFNVLSLLIIIFIPCALCESVSCCNHEINLENISIPTGIALKMPQVKKNSESDMVRKVMEIKAYHEAGHVCVAQILGVTVKNVKIFGDNMGGATQLEMPIVLKASEIKKQIMITYGGFISERCMLGEASNGSIGSESSDMEQANCLLKDYILLSDDTLSFTGFEEDHIKTQCIELSKTLKSEVESIIIANQDEVKKIANELMEKSIITYK